MGFITRFRNEGHGSKWLKLGMDVAGDVFVDDHRGRARRSLLLETVQSVKQETAWILTCCGHHGWKGFLNLSHEKLCVVRSMKKGCFFCCEILEARF